MRQARWFMLGSLVLVFMLAWHFWPRAKEPEHIPAPGTEDTTPWVKQQPPRPQGYDPSEASEVIVEPIVVEGPPARVLPMPRVIVPTVDDTVPLPAGAARPDVDPELKMPPAD